MFVWAEIQSATLLHRAIVTLQLFELTWRGFAHLPLSPRWSLRQSRIRARPICRNGNALPRFAVGSIRFFVTFFFVVFFFGFMPMPILVLAFIAAQTAAAAALLLRAESLATKCPSVR